MLVGPWGVGKSRFIFDYMAQRESSDFAYVSLNGVTATSGLGVALISGTVPVANGVKPRAAAGLVAAYLRAKIPLPISPAAFQTLVSSNSVYVFDDLERSTLSINAILGFINPFVEHSGCRVIIIGNEDQIKDKATFRAHREKVIGQVLHVQPDFDAAIEAFTKLIPTHAAGVLQANEVQVRRVFAQSRVDNLRVLRHALHDFARLTDALPDDLRASPEAVGAALLTWIAVSMEYKSGTLSKEDFAHRGSQFARRAKRAMGGKSSGADAVMEEASERYENDALEDEILSNDFLLELLVRGRVDALELERSFRASRFFRAGSPDWLIAMKGMTESEHEFNAAVSSIESRFAARQILIEGELRQVFGLRLWLARIGVLPVSVQQTVQEARQYIDDLRDRGELPLCDDDHSVLRNSYGGYVVVESDSPEYAGIIEYLTASQDQQETASLPRSATALLDVIRVDPGIFSNAISDTAADRPLRFFDKPIFAHISAIEFVDALLAIDAGSQFRITDALRRRYERAPKFTNLKHDRAILTDIAKLLIDRARAVSPISRARLHKLAEEVEYCVDCLK